MAEEVKENVFDLLESGGDNGTDEDGEDLSSDSLEDGGGEESSSVPGGEDEDLDDDGDGTGEGGEDEISELRRQLESMRAFVSSISVGAQQPPQPQTRGEAEANSQRPYKEADFVGDVDVEELTKEDLNRVINEAVKAAISHSKEEVLLSIPRVVSDYTTKHVSLQNAVKKFYDDNDDLAEHRQTVSYIANQVATANPEWNLKQVFDETATRTRQIMGLKEKTAKKANKNKKKTPAKISSGGSGKAGKPVSKEEKRTQEIMDLMS